MKESTVTFPTYDCIKSPNSTSEMNLYEYIDMNNNIGTANYLGTVMNKTTFFEYCS